MNHVLAAVDFSSATAGVLETAADLVQRSRGSLLLVHVVAPPPAVPEFDLSGENQPELLAAAERAADAELETLRQKLEARKIEAQVLRRTGSPAIEIVEQAKRMHAETIVIGSHGDAATRDFLGGRTVKAVVEHATCPVLVVPASRWLPRAPSHAAVCS